MLEAADQDADQAEIHHIENDHTDDAREKVGAVLQSRLHRHAYQSEVECDRVHSAALHREPSMNLAPGPTREEHQYDGPEDLQTQPLQGSAATDPFYINGHGNVVNRLKGKQFRKPAEKIRKQPERDDLSGEKGNHGIVRPTDTADIQGDDSQCA